MAEKEPTKIIESNMTLKDKERAEKYPAEIEALRAAHLAHSASMKDKVRFGLFSQPGSIALGETNMFPKKVARRDPEDGSVVLGPRNFTTKPLKKGSTDNELFSAPSYNCRLDVYKPAQRDIKRTTVKDGHLRAGHDAAYKPAKTVKETADYKAAYEHLPEQVFVKKNFKDPEDGSVVIGPRNFTTKPPKKGQVGAGTSFGGIPKAMADGYDAAKQQRRKELESHWDIINKVQEGKRFFQRVRSTTTFNTAKAVYGEDVPLPHRPISVRKPTTVEHERAFRPAMPIRTGQVKCTLSRFPEYKENPPKQL